jgi:hypothetical protein
MPNPEFMECIEGGTGDSIVCSELNGMTPVNEWNSVIYVRNNTIQSRGNFGIMLKSLSPLFFFGNQQRNVVAMRFQQQRLTFPK